MAYWIQETSNNHNMSNYRLFHCDYSSDIDKLPRFGVEGEKQENDSISHKPCAYGSECICLQDGGSKWVLGKAANKWIKLNPTVSSGSSDNNNNDLNIATKEEVDDVLNQVFGGK